MIDEDGNRYYIYTLHKMTEDKKGTIHRNDPEKVVIGYKDNDGYIVTLPFGRRFFPWYSEGYHGELKGQLAYYIANYSGEIFEYEDILGEKANVIKSSRAEILELSRTLYEKKENKIISSKKDEMEASDEVNISPVVAYIVPVRKNKYVHYESYYKICSYIVGYSNAMNVCKDLNNKEYQVYSTGLSGESEYVLSITPLEYMIDNPKEKYTNEELLEIEKNLNDVLSAENQAKKQELIDQIAEEIRKEREAKKREAEEKRKKEEEERKRAEEEKIRKEEEEKRRQAAEEEKRKQEEELQRLKEEALRIKKEKRDRIFGAPKRVVDKFHKRREKNLKEMYETFNKVAGEVQPEVLTLDDSIRANRRIEDTKKQLESEIDEIRKMVLTNLDRLSELDKEVTVTDKKKVRVKIPEKELIVKIDGVRQINSMYLPYLEYIDFSFVDIRDLKVSGIHWEKTNISIDPQLVYKKDLSGCTLSDANITWKKFDGCNLEDCDISDEVESKGFETAITNENTKLPVRLLARGNGN